MHAINAQFIYTEAEASRCARAVTESIRSLWFVMNVLPGLAAIGVVASIYVVVSGRSSASDVGVGFALCVFFALGPTLVRLKSTRDFQRNPSAGKVIHWEFTSECLSNSTDGANASSEWRKLIEVKEVKHGFLLYPQPLVAHWVPKHAFESENDLQAFRDLVRRSEVKFNG